MRCLDWSAGPTPSAWHRPRRCQDFRCSQASAPCERPLSPCVGEADQQDGDKDQHADEAAEEEVPEGQRPQIDEHDFDIESDKQKCIDVERQAEPAVGVTVCVDARFVRKPLVLIATVAVRDKPRHADRDEYERDASESEPDDIPDAGQPNSLRATRGGPRRYRRLLAEGTATGD